MVQQYLKLYLKFVIAKRDEEADEIIRGLAIAHAYGSLGEIGTQSLVPFGAPDMFVGKAAEGIRTYNEEHPNVEVARIRSIVSRATKIVFLGCAFHQQNLDLLFEGTDPSLGQKRVLLGTCMGLSGRRRDEVIKQLSQYGNVGSLVGTTCSEFVRDNEDVIFS
jgi:hypothetical protein